MYKKDEFKKLDAKYNTHLYTGLLGYAMRYSHRQLEKFNGKKKYSKVLEIGAGSAPHIDYLRHEYEEYFVAETSSHALKLYKGMKNIKAYSYDGAKLPFSNNFFGEKSGYIIYVVVIILSFLSPPPSTPSAWPWTNSSCHN